jgi:hypothetical protein
MGGKIQIFPTSSWKHNQRLFLRISALASKKRSNQKNKGTYLFKKKKKNINSFS